MVKTSLTTLLVLLLCGCKSTDKASKVAKIPPFPTSAHTTARIPSEKYAPGSIVYIEKDSIVKVAQLEPPTSAIEKNRDMADGSVTGSDKSGLTLGIGLSMVAIPISTDLQYDSRNSSKYSFEWREAQSDTILLKNPEYERQLLTWLNEARGSHNPVLQGKSFFLIQEAVKARKIGMTVSGDWTVNYKASVTATIMEAAKLSPTAGYQTMGDQSIKVTNNLSKPLYISYILIPLKVKHGSSGQGELIKNIQPYVAPLLNFQDASSQATP